MSQSLASAKKRRAPNDPVRPLSTSQEQTQINNNMQTGLTLPQVIQLVDRRLIILEKFMNENHINVSNSMKDNNNSPNSVKEYVEINEDEIAVPSQFKEIVEEFNTRYELLAEEIVNLKNIVLNLQSYTMEVNKVLYDERDKKKEEVV